VKITELLHQRDEAAGSVPPDEPVLSALPAVDEAIAAFAARTYVPASEVVDALLEIRLAVELQESLAATV
jgi:hypothetical protein